MSLFGGGAGAAPEPPKFKKANIEKTASNALKFDELGWQLSDNDLLARFPGLVATRNANIEDAAKQLTGPLDPAVENQFTTKGLGDAMSAFGGGQDMADIGSSGSAARGSVAASVAQQTQNKQDADRATFSQLLMENPGRIMGLTGQDAVSLAIANILGQNQSNYSSYAANVQSGAASGAANSQAIMAALQMAVAVAGMFASDARVKENIRYMGHRIMGIPMATFNYIGDARHLIGVIAQDVRRVIPQAVVEINGILHVSYRLLGITMEETV